MPKPALQDIQASKRSAAEALDSSSLRGRRERRSLCKVVTIGLVWVDWVGLGMDWRGLELDGCGLDGVWLGWAWIGGYHIIHIISGLYIWQCPINSILDV